MGFAWVAWNVATLDWESTGTWQKMVLWLDCALCSHAEQAQHLHVAGDSIHCKWALFERRTSTADDEQ
jgi:hypothetical protein